MHSGVAAVNSIADQRLEGRAKWYKARMTTPLVTASKNEGVMVLELRNPPANTYSYEMMRELDAHVLEARMDETVHVLLISGAGEKFFCAGADIAMLERANPYFKHDGVL